MSPNFRSGNAEVILKMFCMSETLSRLRSAGLVSLLQNNQQQTSIFSEEDDKIVRNLLFQGMFHPLNLHSV